MRMFDVHTAMKLVFIVSADQERLVRQIDNEPTQTMNGFYMPHRWGEKRTYSRRSLYGRIAHEIGTQIIRGELPPGSIVPNELEFSASEQVSRTAFREALKVLASKGLIESRPKVGTRVRPRETWNILDPDILSWIFSSGPDLDYGADLFELRRIIEPAAAGIAAERHTPETLQPIEQALTDMEANKDDMNAGLEPDLRFHRSIVLATGNKLLVPMIYLIESALAETIKLTTQRPQAWENSIPLHAKVLKAIQARDVDGAAKAMLKLLDSARSDMEHVLSEETEDKA